MRLKKCSTKFLRLYISLSYSRGLRALERGGITALPPESSINCTKSLLSYPLSAKTKHFANVRTRIHNHSTPSERVFCRPAALKNLAIHKVLSAFFRLAGQQNPSPIRHPLIMNTGSKTIYKPWNQSNIIQIAS